MATPALDALLVICGCVAFVAWATLYTLKMARRVAAGGDPWWAGETTWDGVRAGEPEDWTDD